MKLKLITAARKTKDRIAAWAARVQSYPFRRTVFNAQRAHKHPALMTAAKRSKLRRT